MRLLWQRVCSQSCISFRRLSVSGRWPRPHRAARTSIPLRSISVVAFATYASRLRPHRATRTSIPHPLHHSVVAFATYASRLRPHRATRTSIPLRFISVVAFATYASRLRPHRATRTSIPLRFISVVAFATYAHGFVRIEQRVPRFRFASSRSWLSPHAQKRGADFWNASIPQSAPLFCARCSMLNVKNRRPAASMSAKTAISSARSGFEPWTP